MCWRHVEGRDDATLSRKSVKKRNGDEKRGKKSERKKNQKKTGKVGEMHHKDRIHVILNGRRLDNAPDTRL